MENKTLDWKPIILETINLLKNLNDNNYREFRTHIRNLGKTYDNIDISEQSLFLLDLEEKINQLIYENPPLNSNKFQLKSINNWIDRMKLNMILNNEIFEDEKNFLYYFITDVIGYSKDENEIIFNIKSTVKKVKYKKEFILWAKNEIKSEIDWLKEINTESENILSKELTDIRINSLEFGLQVFNEIDLLEESKETSIETEPNITAKNKMQTVLLIIEFGLIDYLVKEFNLSETQAFKILGTLTGIENDLIRRYFQGYKQGIELPNTKNNNNPATESNRIWLLNLLNTYKINKPK